MPQAERITCLSLNTHMVSHLYALRCISYAYNATHSMMFPKLPGPKNYLKDL